MIAERLDPPVNQAQPDPAENPVYPDPTDNLDPLDNAERTVSQAHQGQLVLRVSLDLLDLKANLDPLDNQDHEANRDHAERQVYLEPQDLTEDQVIFFCSLYLISCG